MVNNPITVTNYVNPIDSTRKALLDEENEKIQGRRGFVFKGFKTEKERIEEYMKEKNFYYNGLSEHSLSHANKGEILNSSGILQPTMRFKPRTDLERICETINQNSFNRADKSVVDKQLRDLELNVTKVNNKIDVNAVPDYRDMQNSGYLKTENNVFGKEEERNKAKSNNRSQNMSMKVKQSNFSKKKEMNSEARNLIKDLYFKTHFKGATVIATQGKCKLFSNLFL